MSWQPPGWFTPDDRQRMDGLVTAYRDLLAAARQRAEATSDDFERDAWRWRIEALYREAQDALTRFHARRSHTIGPESPTSPDPVPEAVPAPNGPQTAIQGLFPTPPQT